MPLARWGNNKQRVDMSLHSDTLFWFRANQSLLFLLNAAFLAEKQQIPICYSSVWPDRGSYPQSIVLEASMLTITLPMRFPIFINCFNQNIICKQKLIQNNKRLSYLILYFFLLMLYKTSTCKIFWLCAVGFFSQLVFI